MVSMVSCAARDARPHPEERAGGRRFANANVRTRVSKDEDELLRSPSCFETHRSAGPLWKHLCSRGAAMLLSMRARGARRILAKRTRGSFWPNEANRVVLAKRTQAESVRSEEHTSELQSLRHLVCRLL